MICLNECIASVWSFRLPFHNNLAGNIIILCILFNCSQLCIDAVPVCMRSDKITDGTLQL